VSDGVPPPIPEDARDDTDKIEILGAEETTPVRPMTCPDCHGPTIAGGPHWPDRDAVIDWPCAMHLGGNWWWCQRSRVFVQVLDRRS
jgi:hypothetical protein